jgi:hypothetical protein
MILAITKTLAWEFNGIFYNFLAKATLEHIQIEFFHFLICDKEVRMHPLTMKERV